MNEPGATESKLQRYLLEAPIGQGGQGRTFRARDRQSGRPVAVKVIRLRDSDGWKSFDLFERECAVLRGLSHPGIPRFLDTFSVEDKGEFYLVMELVEGPSLHDLMRRGQPLGPAQLWNILHQALDILHYLHGLAPPVIHRDLKPANLLLRPDGRLCLVDFGGVRVALRPEGGSTMVGTFGYMAPEQLHGEATAATDIFGLGATLAALASGVEADRLPRKGLKVDLTSVLLGSPLSQLLSRMLEPDPEQRLASVEAVRRAADLLQAGAAGASSGGARPGLDPGPTGDAGEEDPGEESPLSGVPPPLVALLRVLGAMGFVGLVLLDAIFLPVAFAMIAAAGSKDPQRIGRLRQREQEARKALQSGRRSLKALAAGRNPYQKGQGPRELPGPPQPPVPRLPGRGRGRGGRGHHGR